MSDRSTPDLDVTAIVIAYKSEERIVETIRSHERALAHLDAEVLIVDNDSGDRTVELARATLRQGRVIANDSNLGYGEAANQGIRQARGRACLILNDDAQFDGDTINKLLSALHSDDEVALAGPKIVAEDGTPMPAARRDFPGPAEEFRRIGDLLRGANINYEYPVSGTEVSEVAWVLGACMLGNTAVLREVGGFNPAFFLYGEDIDLCRRLKELGYRVVTVPEAVCVHTGSVSTTEAFSDDARIRRRAGARDIFYRIWYPKPVRSLIHLRRAVGIHHQPPRLGYHLSKVFRDGGSLADKRFPPPLSPG